MSIQHYDLVAREWFETPDAWKGIERGFVNVETWDRVVMTEAGGSWTAVLRGSDEALRGPNGGRRFFRSAAEAIRALDEETE